MKKTEIVDVIARKYKLIHPDRPLPRSDISEIVNLFVGVIEDTLLEYGEFSLTNLFRLYTYKSKRTKGYNGFEGEYITYEPRYTLKIKTSNIFREKLNAKDKKTNNCTRTE